MLIFFFSSRRRHTRCSRDWSSDVCSSDLRFGVPVVLVHLPNKAEISVGRPFRWQEAESIWTQLERDLGTRIVTLAAMENRPATPPTIDLQPNNAHPNLDGIKFYGEYVTMVIEPRVKRQSSRWRSVRKRPFPDRSQTSARRTMLGCRGDR